MSLCCFINNKTKGIGTANDLIQIMNIGNVLYSYMFVTISWKGIINALCNCFP